MESNDDIFLNARELNNPDGRAAYLANACAGDSDLRARVEAMLRDAEEAEKFFGPNDSLVTATHVTEAPGSLIGRYKLLEKIGEGGMGVVYMAEQREPVLRKVALKIIKAGMDTRQVIARFEAERQALALMDHPNIAKVLDGGETENGRPYFVMDLVQGLPITQFCDEAKLSTRERLELFLDVCSAIQHAHQKGIIHRDIKPTNILVTLHGDKPVPKVIDFGVAKATQQPLTDKTLFTQFQHFIGTPAYMSPEQASLSGLDIDTRSDIYGLGVLLYELLTGTTPFDGKELLKSGLDEMRRTIREKEPPRPSTRLRTLSAAELTTAAQRRQAEPVRLVTALRGDLDWVVMKCLEKDRARRYETANSLAGDIRRSLNHEAVVARPPTVSYRLQKAIRRNKGAFAAGAITVLLLTLGLGLTTWQALRATRAENRETVARKLAESNEKEARQSEAREAALRAAAQTQARLAQHRAYAADMKLAQHGVDRGELDFPMAILNRYRPRESEEDLRGWEWRYLWRQAQSDAVRVVQDPNIGFVSGMPLSPDGKFLVRCGVRGFLLSHMPEGRLLGWELTNCSVDGGVFLNSRVVALACDETNQTSIRTWDVIARRPGYVIPLGGGCQGLATARNGELLFSWAQTASGSEEVTMWRAADGQRLRSWPTENGIRWINLKRVFAVSPDGRLVAHRLWPDSIRVFSVETGETLWTAKASVEMLSAICFSPDGKLLASSGAYSIGAIQLWEASTGRPVASFEGLDGWIRELAFTEDSQRLISIGAGAIRVWDVPARRLRQALRGAGGGRFALLPGEKQVVSARSNGALTFWDLTDTAQPKNVAVLPEPALAWAFDEDSRSVVTVAPGGAVLRWFAPDFREKAVLLQTPEPPLAPLISPNGRVLAVTGSNGAVQVWDLVTRERRHLLTSEAREIAGCEFSNDGRFLKTSDVSNQLSQMWDTGSGQEIAAWSTPRGFDYMSPDGRFRLKIDANGDVSLRDIRTGETRHGHWHVWMPGYHRGFSPDGKYFTVANDHAVVQFFDVALMTETTVLNGSSSGQYTCSLAFSWDMKRLATGGTGTQSIKLWDLETKFDLITLPTSASLFIPPVFSRDGNFIGARTSGGAAQLPHGGILYIWRAASWEEIAAAERIETERP